MVGGQGGRDGVTVQQQTVQPFFYRQPVVSGYSGEGTDGYCELAMGDSGRVDKMMD